MEEYRKLIFSGDEVTDDLWRRLEADRELEQLTIWGGPIDNARLEPLRRMTWLKGLALGEMAVDDGLFEHLQEMRKLELLILAYTNNSGDFSMLSGVPLRDVRLEGSQRIGDRAVRSLAAFPTLRNLEVHMTSVTDHGLESLANSALEVLWVGPLITNTGMKTIGTMKRLKHLDVCARAVGDDGVRAISGLRDLEVLWLTHCRITNAVLDTLCAFPLLKELAVGDTAITAEGREHLTRSLPGCRLVDNDPEA